MTAYNPIASKPNAAAEDCLGLDQVLEAIRSLHGRIDELQSLLNGHRKQLLTIEEVARLCGRAPFTVRTWVKSGKLSAIRVAGTGPKGRLLVPRTELERVIGAGGGAQVPDSALD